MLLLGASIPGRHTEQHDIIFAIGNNPAELVPAILDFWPEAAQKIHVDGWREVTQVDGFDVTVIRRDNLDIKEDAEHLFFLNLGGYKRGEFEEFHYKMVTVGTDKRIAIEKAKKTAFYKHVGFEHAPSHVDDKYGIDVDDIFKIEEILPADTKAKYTIQLTPSQAETPDEIHLGYFKMDRLPRY